MACIKQLKHSVVFVVVLLGCCAIHEVHPRPVQLTTLLTIDVQGKGSISQNVTTSEGYENLSRRIDENSEAIDSHREVSEKKMNENRGHIGMLTVQMEMINIRSILDKMFPVGSIYIAYDQKAKPPLSEVYGIIWKMLPEGHALISSHPKNSGTTSGSTRLDNGETNGHVLTIDEMPAHSHGYVKPWSFKGMQSNDGGNFDNGLGSTSETGGNKPHQHSFEILNVKVVMWRRVA